MDVRLLSGALGAEINGIDLKDTTLKNFKVINNLLLEHKVIFFRRQNITPEEQLTLASRFGPIEQHAYVKGLDEYPEIVRIIKDRTNFNVHTKNYKTCVRNLKLGWTYGFLYDLYKNEKYGLKQASVHQIKVNAHNMNSKSLSVLTQSAKLKNNI